MEQNFYYLCIIEELLQANTMTDTLKKHILRFCRPILCFLILTAPAQPALQARNLDSLLVVLDSCIMQRHVYEQHFLRSQDVLWNKAEQETDAKKAMKLWERIGWKELRYKADRSINAFNRARKAAREAGDKQGEYHIIAGKASIYGTLGLPWEAHLLLDSLLRQKDLAPDYRCNVYSVYYDAYRIFRMNILPRELSDFRLHGAHIAEDSLKALNLPALNAAFTLDRSSSNVPYMIGLLQKELSSVPDEEKAVTAHILANKYELLGDMAARDYYRALSAIYSMRHAQYELPALGRLAKTLYERGDRERARRYALAAYENADIFGSIVRKVEVASLLADMAKAGIDEDISDKKNVRFWRLMALLSLLLCSTAGTLYFRKYRRERDRCEQLEKKQKECSEYIDTLKSHTEVRDEYLTRFLELSLDAVYEVEQLRRLTLMRLNAGEYDRLKKSLADSTHLAAFQKESLMRFDVAFLRLYPDFPRKVNKLMQPDGQIELSDTQLLSNELRILAFMKLGINDGARIATILGISVNTLYFYRNRFKRRAISRATFESDIMAL